MRIGRVMFGSQSKLAIHHQDVWISAEACGPVTAGSNLMGLLNLGTDLNDTLEQLDVAALMGVGSAIPFESANYSLPLDRGCSIIAVGLNYLDHTRELDWQSPKTPLLFAKWPSSLAGPYSAITLDRSISEQVDYEVELVVVIGRTALNVVPEHALEYVAGYAVANDISARDIQMADGQWTRAKSFDGFCPIGPWITTADAVPDPQALGLMCSVNGQMRQKSTTSSMIFNVAELISFATQSTTLQAGDVILTGTPSGVAMGSESPKWLQPGDVVRSEIEGLGFLENSMTGRV